MMRINNIAIYAACLLGMMFSMTSCVDLDPYPIDELSEEETWNYPERVQGIIGSMYKGIEMYYLNNEAVFLECATDNAVSTSLTRDMTNLALNTLIRSTDPFIRFWERDYKHISSANNFLKDNRGLHLRYMTDEKKNRLLSRRLQGEAYGLRAWYYWDLLQKFGGASLNSGELLGVPMVLEPVENPVGMNVPRAKYDDCVRQIIADCDSAIHYLPIANRDFLSDTPEIIGSRGWSRVDGITMKSVKAMVYLAWASPRFNPRNEVARWDSVAKYAREVIEFKLKVDSRDNPNNPNRKTAFSPELAIDWVNPSFAGAVWASQYETGQTNIERSFYPGGFNGNGELGPTQELVDAFGMKNGYPITDPRGEYDPEHPYENREPRFYSTIFYNGETIRRSSSKKEMYTFDMTTNGKDVANLISKNSLTNYYLRKFVFMDVDLLDANNTGNGRRCRLIIEWSHMCLAFAEAANHVVGPTTPLYGMTAKEAIRYIRMRDTENGDKGLLVDPYLDEMAQNKDKFDELVKNERRLTLCFDGSRFYDLRRWDTSMDELNKPVHRVEIKKGTDGKLIYSYPEVQKRNFTSPFLPIPYKAMLRMTELQQNEGWDIWK